MATSTNIYFFQSGNLVKRLSQSALSSREAFFYIVYEYLVITLSNLIGTIGKKSSGELSVTMQILVAVIVTLIIVPIVLLIIRAIYRANGGDQGKDFLGRLLALSFVAVCRISAPLIPLFILFRLVQAGGFSTVITLSVSSLVMIVGLGATFYGPYFVYSRMKEIRNIEESDSSPQI